VIGGSSAARTLRIPSSAPTLAYGRRGPLVSFRLWKDPLGMLGEIDVESPRVSKIEVASTNRGDRRTTPVVIWHADMFRRDLRNRGVARAGRDADVSRVLLRAR